MPPLPFAAARPHGIRALRHVTPLLSGFGASIIVMRFPCSLAPLHFGCPFEPVPDITNGTSFDGRFRTGRTDHLKVQTTGITAGHGIPQIVLEIQYERILLSSPLRVTVRVPVTSGACSFV